MHIRDVPHKGRLVAKQYVLTLGRKIDWFTRKKYL